MKLRALIVDDEDLARSVLRRLLADEGGVEIVGEASNGVEALEAIAELRPDVVLLDIEMPGFDGFEVVQQLENSPAIVFVTAYDEYAVRAFEANAIDYLLKPVRPERLERALGRVRERRGSPPDASRVREIREVARERGGPLQRIAARRGKRIVIVPVRDIIRIEIEDKLVFAVKENDRLLIEKTITELETMLEPAGFLRISRGELVNLETVKELLPWFSGTWRVKLANGEERDVSRDRAKQLREAMGIG
ncbi:MAG TPA: LytTR family DNA-binding domain-containing protein [Bryobacteraceae bacterium]|nr:LytTR family DNA-binding domain-containing protein [Bryobacteraceae bacterium]